MGSGPVHNEKLPEKDFIALFESLGPRRLAARLGYKSLRAVFSRRADIEERRGVKIMAPKDTKALAREGENPARLHLKIDDGMVLIGSDSHYLPGEVSTAHRAFIHFCKQYKQKLKAVITNGDELDGATIS